MVSTCSGFIFRLNRWFWKLLVLVRDTQNYITVCKLFVSGIVTWSYNCLQKRLTLAWNSPVVFNMLWANKQPVEIPTPAETTQLILWRKCFVVKNGPGSNGSEGVLHTPLTDAVYCHKQGTCFLGRGLTHVNMF